MLRELAANWYKGGWMQTNRRTHFEELDYHLAKLKAAVRAGDKPERILEFSADLANHAMFLADSEGALTEDVMESRGKEASFVRPNLKVYRRLMWNPRWIKKGWGGFKNVRSESHPEPRELRPMNLDIALRQDDEVLIDLDGTVVD
jgi:hypothetical protein